MQVIMHDIISKNDTEVVILQEMNQVYRTDEAFFDDVAPPTSMPGDRSKFN